MSKISLLFATVACTIGTIAAQPTDTRSDTVSVAVYGGRLHGTLLQTVGGTDRPVVLIIAGSGPTDRDGNNPMSGKNNSLRMLAEGLAQYNINSLRFDKRGIGKSIGALQREQSLVFEQNSADAAVWIQWLHEKGFKRIYLAGHSEGSLVALQAAQTIPVSGLISLAGAGRPIQDILREQLSNTPEPIRSQAYAYIDSLSQGKKIPEPSLSLFSLFRPAIQDYLISWMKLDPAALLARLYCPILIVQGERDLQVKVADAYRLAEANPAAELLILSTMNHLFKSVRSDDLQENLNTYKDPNLPVLPELIQRMARFIR